MGEREREERDGERGEVWREIEDVRGCEKEREKERESMTKEREPEREIEADYGDRG